MIKELFQELGRAKGTKYLHPICNYTIHEEGEVKTSTHNHDSESQGQEEVGHVQQTCELFTHSTTL